MQGTNHVDVCGLTENQIKEILKATGGRYNKVEGRIICRNFDQSQKARDLKNKFIRQRVKGSK